MLFLCATLLLAGVIAVMLCVRSRGCVSGRVGARAGGGSHCSGAVDCVRVALEEQVSKPYISFTAGNKALKHANVSDSRAHGVTLLYYFNQVPLVMTPTNKSPTVLCRLGNRNLFL